MITALPSALARAVAQLPERGLRGPLLATILWTVLAFVPVWFGAIYAVRHVAERFGAYGVLAEIGVVVLLLLATWLAFSLIENTILVFYTDRIIAAVEARYYPAMPPAGSAGWRDTLSSGIWLLVCTVFGNLVLLPIYFFLPGVNLVLFLLLNGYVLGRGYFDAVTLRRMDGRTARLVWRANRAAFIVNGALAAFLLTIPGLNLVAPIVGLAATVHLLEWRPDAA